MAALTNPSSNEYIQGQQPIPGSAAPVLGGYVVAQSGYAVGLQGSEIVVIDSSGHYVGPGIIFTGNLTVTGNLHVTGTSALDGAVTLLSTLTLPLGDLTIGSTAVTSSAAELNTLHGVTAGTVTASKALVVDANKRLDTLVIGTLNLGAGAGTAVTATATQLNYNAGVVTPGTVAVSSTVVTDANGSVGFPSTAFIGLGGLAQAAAAGVWTTCAPFHVTLGTNNTAVTIGTITFTNVTTGLLMRVTIIAQPTAASAGNLTGVETFNIASARQAGAVMASVVSTGYGLALAKANSDSDTYTTVITAAAESGGATATNTQAIQLTCNCQTAQASGAYVLIEYMPFAAGATFVPAAT